MMKNITCKLLFLSCMLLPVAVRAQNWQPFLRGDVAHYYHNGNTAELKQSVQVQQAQVQGADSVYTFLPVMALEDTVFMAQALSGVCALQAMLPAPATLRNQPTFAGSRMRFNGNGWYYFEAGGSGHPLPATAGLSTSWVWDTLNALQATITNVSQRTLWGQADSVKTALLSNGDSLVWSRAHGLLYWPGKFSLGGLQHRGAGLVLPTMRQIFDFQVGDVLQYNFQASEIMRTESGTFKLEFTGRADAGNVITYTATRHYNVVEMGPGVIYHIGTDVHTFTVTDSADHPFNLGAGLVTSADSFAMGQGLWHYRPAYSAGDISQQCRSYLNSRAGADSAGVPWRIIGSLSPDMDLQHHNWLPDPLHPDTLVSSTAYDMHFHQRFQAGLGFTHMKGYGFEWGAEETLVGYVKNGDTTGVITPTPVLLARAEASAHAVTAWPSPAQDWLCVRTPTAAGGEACMLDLSGRVVLRMSLTGAETTLDLHTLPAGMYLLRVELAQGAPQTLRVAVQR